jgi:CheY-like chemotaxis protein
MLRTILTIDDDQNITDVIKLTLESTGMYEVRVVNDSKQALPAIRKIMPDLILLDLMMPSPSGEEIIEQLQDDPELKKLKYVFLTSLIEKIDPNKPGKLIGGKAFLSKPINVQQLIHFVDSQFFKTN